MSDTNDGKEYSIITKRKDGKFMVESGNFGGKSITFDTPVNIDEPNKVIEKIKAKAEAEAPGAGTDGATGAGTPVAGTPGGGKSNKKRYLTKQRRQKQSKKSKQSRKKQKK